MWLSLQGAVEAFSPHQSAAISPEPKLADWQYSVDRYHFLSTNHSSFRWALIKTEKVSKLCWRDIVTKSLIEARVVAGDWRGREDEDDAAAMKAAWVISVFNDEDNKMPISCPDFL